MVTLLGGSNCSVSRMAQNTPPTNTTRRNTSMMTRRRCLRAYSRSITPILRVDRRRFLIRPESVFTDARGCISLLLTAGADSISRTLSRQTRTGCSSWPILSAARLGCKCLPSIVPLMSGERRVSATVHRTSESVPAFSGLGGLGSAAMRPAHSWRETSKGPVDTDQVLRHKERVIPARWMAGRHKRKSLK